MTIFSSEADFPVFEANPNRSSLHINKSPDRFTQSELFFLGKLSFEIFSSISKIHQQTSQLFYFLAEYVFYTSYPSKKFVGKTFSIPIIGSILIEN